jgi:signal transduction histidine kinase
MNGILGFTSLLKNSELSPEKLNDYVGIIEESGARMLNTINDIVDFSKIQSGLEEVNYFETNINKELKFIYSFFSPEAEAKGLKLSFKNELAEHDSNIITDKEKVLKALTNLVKNAIKFTDSGSIEFGYKLKADSEPVELEFFVKDTGIGIPANNQALV